MANPRKAFGSPYRPPSDADTRIALPQGGVEVWITGEQHPLARRSGQRASVPGTAFPDRQFGSRAGRCWTPDQVARRRAAADPPRRSQTPSSVRRPVSSQPGRAVSPSGGGSIEQQAGSRAAVPAPTPAAQLVKLGEAEMLGALVTRDQGRSARRRRPRSHPRSRPGGRVRPAANRPSPRHAPAAAAMDSRSGPSASDNAR